MSATFLPHYLWAATLGASMFLWCFYWVRPRFGIFASSLLAYLCASSIWVWVWVENRYYPIAPYDQMALRYFAADSLARALVLLVPLMLLNKAQRLKGITIAKSFAVLNSVFVILGAITHGCVAENSCGGIGNPSIMVGLSVCILPFMAWPSMVVVALAVVLSKSSIAFGLMAIFLAWKFFKDSRILAGIAFCATFAIGAVMLGTELINSSDRFAVWAYMMPKWAAWWNVFTGTGWGTYHVFSINLQKANEFRLPGHWNTLHNDWLQMVFECGLAGALLMLGTYFTAIRRTFFKGDDELLASLVLFGIYIGANPALHHAIPSLFGAWLIVHALKTPTKEHLCLV